MYGVIAVEIGSLFGVNIWIISFLGGVNDIFKNSAVLCCGFTSFSIFLASFFSVFFLAFSAFPSSLCAYFNSASIASLPVKPVKFNPFDTSFFSPAIGGGGAGGSGGGPFPAGGGLTSCLISRFGVSGSFGMAPPQVIITQPPADNSNNNSLLSSFITSKMLNETMNLNRSNMTNVEPSRIEQPSYFNARESIIPRLPDTPIKQEVKPPTKTGPPIPPPPPPPIMGNKKELPKELNLTGLSGRDAMLAELKFAQSDEGKAEKARKKAEKESKKEAQQSTAEFSNMSFTPPKRDIVEMMTPIQSNPIQSNPTQSNPIQSNPTQSNVIQSNPILSNPIQSIPRCAV